MTAPAGYLPSARTGRDGLPPAVCAEPAEPGERAARQSPQGGRRSDAVRLALVAAIWALPLLRPAGPGNTGPVDIFIGIAVGIVMLWLASRRMPVRFPFALPVGISILAGTLASTVAYADKYVSVGHGLLTVVQDMFCLAWGLAVANAGRSPALLRSMTRAWAVSATFWSALMIVGVLGHISLLSGETARDGARAAFTLGDPNLAADYFVCSLLVLRAARYPARRLARWACCAVIIAAIVFTGSNGGMLALAAATVAGALFRLATRRGAAPAVMVAAAIGLCAVAVIPHIDVTSLVQRAQASTPLLQDSIGRQAESSGSRDTILSETEQLYFTADNPLGIGPGGTKPAFQQHMYGYIKEAHDDYAAALVERGALGAVALVLLLVCILARCRRIAARPLRPAYARIIPRPELLGAAVLAVLASAMFYQVLHFRHVWALLGLVAAADLWGRAEAADAPPGATTAGGAGP